MKRSSLLCWPLLFLCLSASAQQPVLTLPPPKTELEALQLKIGAVIVKGSQRIGSVRGQAQGQVEVEALDVSDASNHLRAHGLALTVEEGGERGREVTAFVDYNELADLIKGLESISRLDRNETQFANFTASYRTKGDLLLSVVSTRGGLTRCIVSSGEFAPATVVITLEELANLRALVTSARNRLDEARAR